MHTRPASRTPAAAAPPRAPSPGRGSSDDWLLDVADRYLDRGRQLKAHVDQLVPACAFQEVFDLTRKVNPASHSYGFFDSAAIEGRPMPIMGNVQEMLFDRARSPREAFEERRQLREFVLRYFMRVSDFLMPDVYVAERGRPSTWWPDALSWCSTRGPAPRGGFGFSQLFAKRAGSNVVERFLPEDQFAIIDLREIGPVYDWLIARVQIFDFMFRFSLPGIGLDITVPLAEESYLVVARDFVTDDPQGGRFGIGYAFVRNRQVGTLAYGPGEFEAAFEQIDYGIEANGQVRVRMFFAANRPTAIVNLSLDPFAWLASGLNVATAGLARRAIGSSEEAYRRLRLRWPTVDPVYLFIALANLLTLGQAAEQACISTDQPDRLFLAQHFRQHYQAITGSMATWRHVRDWTDDASLPDWVRRGTFD